MISIVDNKSYSAQDVNVVSDKILSCRWPHDFTSEVKGLEITKLVFE